MLVTTGTVHGDIIEFESKELAEGTIVTVLAREGDETFELGPEDELKLLAAIAEANRGEVTSVEQVLRRIKKS